MAEKQVSAEQAATKLQQIKLLVGGEKQIGQACKETGPGEPGSSSCGARVTPVPNFENACAPALA